MVRSIKTGKVNCFSPPKHLLVWFCQLSTLVFEVDTEFEIDTVVKTKMTKNGQKLVWRVDIVPPTIFLSPTKTCKDVPGYCEITINQFSDGQ